MFWIFLVALCILIMGVVQLAFPAFVRNVDRGYNEINGIQTEQGESYEVGRVVRGIVFIVIGAVLMVLVVAFG